MIKYGKEASNDVIIKNIHFNDSGFGSFDLTYFGKDLGTFQLAVPGVHNIYNATSAIIVSLVSGINAEDIKESIIKYTGVGRRFEIKGSYNDALIVDDYAHHPVEIKATLDTATIIPHKNIYAVFQPHTYTRTKTLFEDFTECFSEVDELLLMDIYAAREKDTGIVNSEQLGDAIRAKGIKCTNIHSHEQAANYLKNVVSNDDIILTIGAGDVVKVADIILK